MTAPLTIRVRYERPDLGWHAHGTTQKWIWIVDFDRLRLCLLIKQRWLHVETGTTRHDRPAWDVPHSPFGLDVAFFLLGLWLLGVQGLYRLDWPWSSERPSRRTVQRWYARLRPDGARWQQAIRHALIDLVAPRHLEEILPAGGIPPPEGRARRSRDIAQWCQLPSGAWLITEAARSLSTSIRSLLVVARRRWPVTSASQP